MALSIRYVFCRFLRTDGSSDTLAFLDWLRERRFLLFVMAFMTLVSLYASYAVWAADNRSCQRQNESRSGVEQVANIALTVSRERIKTQTGKTKATTQEAIDLYAQLQKSQRPISCPNFIHVLV